MRCSAALLLGAHGVQVLAELVVGQGAEVHL
jgi:hypothetical protein